MIIGTVDLLCAALCVCMCVWVCEDALIGLVKHLFLSFFCCVIYTLVYINILSADNQIVIMVVLQVASLVKSNKLFLRVSMNPNKKIPPQKIHSCKKHNQSFSLESFSTLK